MADEHNYNPDKVKIGVYVCECGINIGAVVDVKETAAYARTLPDVAVSRVYKYMCSEPGQKLIKDDIKELGLNRIVVASCSPRMHEPTFRTAVSDSGLNPYLFEMTNIREHCSWVHNQVPREATEKAKDLIRMSVAKVRLLEPLDTKYSDVIPSALVVGGGIAGIQAALDIADNGFKVYLVEQTPSIGGRMSQLDKTFPTLDCSACILTPKMVDAGRHPNIELLTYSEVEKVEGYVGNFNVTVRKKAKSIDESLCTGCGQCMEECPVLLQAQIQKRPDKAPPVRNKNIIDEIINDNTHLKGPLVQILLAVNEKYRYLPRDVLEYLSYELETPLSTIYRIATFYKSFSLKLRGKYHIKVCLGTACHVRGARNIADRVKSVIARYEEGLFSLETVNCLGACALGPIMVVNEEVHGHVTVDKVDEIISSLGGE